ncbi:MAG: M48 family metalloprotease [Flavobacteriales bacterium]|nr:M48 family metalloprotease [Bacteroidota bacterium]MCB9239513.1 M48 family metalloprotease [Flavobacteriales bacterium]
MVGCKDEDGNKKSVNLFTLEDDKAFGAQVAAEIEADDQTYPILDSASYPDAYAHLHRITNTILGGGKVQHKDDFVWQLRIIHDDSVLNAFCTPGGYIYVYTGLIKFLESEDQLAGVMGHEIAHADERHSTEALTKQYGTEVLFAILFGNDQGTLAQIAKGMIGLKYSRTNESEADMRSVDYLYPTEYDARGAARFFEKIIAAGGGGGPEFLSTHPNPDNRVEAIFSHWEDLGGKVGETFETRYDDFKKSLP